jgi:hypothetical protein
MNGADLARALADPAAGPEIWLPSDEIDGPQVITRPLRLTGNGPASVIWARTGPVLTIQAPGVQLTNLALEVTEDPGGVALAIEGAARADPPGLENVRLIGRAEGFGRGRRWRVPGVIDFGTLTRSSRVSRWVGFETIGEISCRAEQAGLHYEIVDHGGGHKALHLELDGAGLFVDRAEPVVPTLIEGQLELTAGGLVTLVRITGRVVLDDGLPTTTGETVAVSAIYDVFQERDKQSGSDPVPATNGSLAASLRQRAQGAAQAGELDIAIELYQQAIHLTPGDARLFAELADLQLRTRNVDGAVTCWKRVLALNSHYPRARVNLGRCYHRLERFDDAVAMLEGALRANMSDPETLRSLALAYDAAGRRPEAIWALDNLLALAPSSKLTALRRRWGE